MFKVKNLIKCFAFIYCMSLWIYSYATESDKFFEMDFEKNTYSMNDVSEVFFKTFPHDDPTQGDVVYDEVLWQNQNMIELKNNDGLYLYVRGREPKKAFDSVRITSKSYYNVNGEEALLFVFKGRLPHHRGMWPAWWLNGGQQATWLYQNDKNPNDSMLRRYSGAGRFFETPSAVNTTDWPSSGEIDIIETINGEDKIHNTLHSCPQMMDARWNDSVHAINCANARENGGDPNPGCSGKSYMVERPEGTFALVWKAKELQFYYWNDNENVRSDGGPLSQKPQPVKWKNNLKNTSYIMDTKDTCDPSKHYDWQCQKCQGSEGQGFKNMKMIFNTTLCGVWAGNKFDTTASSLKNCKDYIFNEGYKYIDGEFIKIEYVSVKSLEKH